MKVQNERFVVDEPDVIARLRSDIERAARTGGAFVAIGESGINVLITPQTSVRVDDIHQDSGAGEVAVGSEFVDFSAY